MKVFYVPWLHMHQPLIFLGNELKSNLEKMIISKDSKEAWDGKLIARAYKNPATYIKKLADQGLNPKIMLDYSGILLESLEELGNRNFFDFEISGEKVGNIIEAFKKILRKYPDCIEFAATAYSHCYFPATPQEDWKLQIEEWKNVFSRIFGKKILEKVKGFWLPELGVPGFGDKLKFLIKVLKEENIEWLFLPLQAVENYEQLSYEERIKIACMPHLLEVEGETIPVVFRAPHYFIDQQAGCLPEKILEKIKEVERIFSKYNKPPIIIPASDGENGNVMMNEFFPLTFEPLFKNFSEEFSSLTITEFLHKFYEKNGEIKPESKIKLKLLGASWINGHKLWLEGLRRIEMVKKIEILSKEFHEVEEKILENFGEVEEIREARKLLLISETSCYVYWNVDFWFEQGEKVMEILRGKINNLRKKYLYHIGKRI
ncbi:MAG: glycoside hydrolase [Candidatus Aenigmatarchaeota archaeon]